MLPLLLAALLLALGLYPAGGVADPCPATKLKVGAKAKAEISVKDLLGAKGVAVFIKADRKADTEVSLELVGKNAKKLGSKGDPKIASAKVNLSDKEQSVRLTVKPKAKKALAKALKKKGAKALPLTLKVGDRPFLAMKVRPKGKVKPRSVTRTAEVKVASTCTSPGDEKPQVSGTQQDQPPPTGTQTPPPTPTEPPETLKAPPIDPTVPTTISDSTKFLYTGDDPIQKGVEDGTIVERRTAVLRGRVIDREGNPLEGVKVTIHGHPEFGYTETRQNGRFDMAVNGGGLLTLEYEKTGLISAQRQIDVPWQDYELEDDVVLIPADDQVSEIRTDSNEVQVARSSQVGDQDGTRRETLIFQPGTQAEAVLPSGESKPLPLMHVRTTEFTQGERGPEAMPAEIALNTAYTYAVEFRVDEAVELGAKSVQFSKPVTSYHENFLNWPVGEIVPLGYYDPDKATWIAEPNGRVVKITSIVDGKAKLDLDGSGDAANEAELAALGVTEDELKTLATLYGPGQTLWRASFGHFSDHRLRAASNSGAGRLAQQVVDENPRSVPDNPGSPTALEALGNVTMVAKNDQRARKPCKIYASIIECENQALRESIPIAGTPYALSYPGEVPGRKAARQLEVTMSGSQVPSDLHAIELRISGAGRTWESTYAPQPNQKTTFTWDGKDAYGRPVNCRQLFSAEVGYTYPSQYVSAAEYEQSFGRFSEITSTIAPARQEITLWSGWTGTIGTCDQRGQGLGGWTIAPHHQYDTTSHTLFSGDGSQRDIDQASAAQIDTVAGDGNMATGWDPPAEGSPASQVGLSEPRRINAQADGGYLIVDMWDNRVRRITAGGTIETVAGTGHRDFSGDGGPATQAALYNPDAADEAPDGSIYIADTYANRIRKVSTDGIITTVAGQGPIGAGNGGFSGDGGPATDARLNEPYDVSVARDGSFYIADSRNQRIRHVGTDGMITTVAGKGQSTFSGDGGSAIQAGLSWVHSVEVTDDGSLYIADSGNQRIRKIDPSGRITTVAGTGESDSGGFSGDGGPATSARLSFPDDVTVAEDGTLYVADSGNNRIRKVDPQGIITTISGKGPINGAPGAFSGDGAQAGQGELDSPRGVALTPDGSLLVADTANKRIRAIDSPAPDFSGQGIDVPSEGGTELYRFDPQGRQQQTIDAITGKPRYRFGYHGGRLWTITDQNDQKTWVETTSDGTPTAIVAPHGQRTALGTNSDGYLTQISNPLGDSYTMTYRDGGLLQTFKNPEGGTSTFTYNDQGFLTRDQNAVGGSYDLERTTTEGGHSVKTTTALGRSHTPTVKKLDNGDEIRDIEGPTGTTKRTFHPDGSKDIETPDGYKISTKQSPDPRWGMQAPFTSSAKIEAPSGKAIDLSCSRDLSLFDPADPTKVKSYTQACTENGRTSTATYNGETQTTSATSPQGRKVSAELDPNGRPVKIDAPGLSPYTFAYDDKGRPAEVGQGDRKAALTYDSQGRLATTKNLATGKTVSQTYDDAGRPNQLSLPGDRKIGFAYDRDGNLTSVTPPGRPAHAFTYNAINLPTSYKPPGGKETAFGWTKDKELKHIGRPDGSSVDFEYDSQSGRPKSITYAGGKTEITYNQSGRKVERLATDDANLAFSYNQDGLTESQITQGEVNGNVSFTYNDKFELASTAVGQTDPVTFTYDNDGLVTKGGDLTLTRDPQTGAVTETNLGSVKTALSTNGYGQTDNVKASFQDQTIFEEGMTSNDEGQIDQRQEQVQGQSQTLTYRYDDAGRLAEVKKDGQTKAQYSYDENGNRTSYKNFDDPSKSVTSTQYDAEDHLLRYGDLTYAYTDNGELKTKTDTGQDKTTNYAYNGLGQLKEVNLPNGKKISYLYDGLGRRIGKKVDGELTQGLIYASQLHPVAEVDGQNQLVARFVYGSGTHTPDYMEKGGNTYKFITDRLGSVRLVVNAETGDVAQRLTYDEYGNVTEDSSPGFQPFGYGGGIHDADTGLVRFGARDYDPNAGRWTTKDPIGLAGGLNLYEYVLGNPVNLVDPTGHGGLYWPPESDDAWRFAEQALWKELLEGKTWSQEKVEYLRVFDADLAKKRDLFIKLDQEAASVRAVVTDEVDDVAPQLPRLFIVYATVRAYGSKAIGAVGAALVSPAVVAAAVFSTVLLWSSPVSGADWDPDYKAPAGPDTPSLPPPPSPNPEAPPELPGPRPPC